MEVIYNEKHVLGELRQRAAVTKYDKDLAGELGVHPSVLCDVLKGRRPISDSLARALGYTKVIRFERRRKK
jgi:hypothetical protein